MKSYIECKFELKKQCSSIKYFNRKFYETYRTAILSRMYRLKNGIEDNYEKDGVVFCRSFDEVYKTDFYNKNSCAYCEFLSIVF